MHILQRKNNYFSIMKKAGLPWSRPFLCTFHLIVFIKFFGKIHFQFFSSKNRQKITDFFVGNDGGGLETWKNGRAPGGTRIVVFSPSSHSTQSIFQQQIRKRFSVKHTRELARLLTLHWHKKQLAQFGCTFREMLSRF